MHCSEQSQVSFADVAMVMGCLKVEESLWFASPVWNEVCFHGNMQPSINCPPFVLQAKVWLYEVGVASERSLFSYLSDSVQGMLAGNGHPQGVGLPHTNLALLILLAVDAQLHGLQWSALLRSEVWCGLV